jgi:hypothetical protein
MNPEVKTTLLSAKNYTQLSKYDLAPDMVDDSPGLVSCSYFGWCIDDGA